MEKLCPRCGATLICKQAAGCWCADLPNLLTVPGPGMGECLCRNCLIQELEKHVASAASDQANK